jgi:spermidine synthase
MQHKLGKYLLFLSFLEGGAVMCTELLGAKMVAPYFGTSLQSWASVLGVTLMALTFGYFLGGFITKSKKEIFYLYLVYLLAGVFMLLMPITSRLIMTVVADWPLEAGLILSLFVFLLPPLLLMGMVSPLTIYHLTESREDSGQKAGLIYAVSTTGGVLFTFLLGFAIIPKFGIKSPAILYGCLMIMVSFVPLIRLGKTKQMLIFLVPLLFFLFYQLNQSNKKAYKNVTIKYNSEGLLGQIKVADVKEAVSGGFLDYRFLLVNNTWQTAVINQAPYFSLFEYVYYFFPIINSFPKGSKALVFGLGGGSIVKKFQQANFDVKVVDIDSRLKNIAVKYFDLNPQTKVEIDDARHYLNNETNKYDVIVFDCFLGETPPAHLLTKEAFEKVKALLNDKGILMIEFYGHKTGNAGLACKMLYKTLLGSGFNCKMLATNLKGEDDNNFIYLASSEPFELNNLMPVTFDYNEKVKDWKDIVYSTASIDFGEVNELTDDKPVLDYLLQESVGNWRKMLNERFGKKMLMEDFPLFY